MRLHYKEQLAKSVGQKHHVIHRVGKMQSLKVKDSIMTHTFLRKKKMSSVNKEWRDDTYEVFTVVFVS
jgi:hypothetical protein